MKFQPAATFFFGVMGDMASKMDMVPEEKALPGKMILHHSATYSCLKVTFKCMVWIKATNENNFSCLKFQVDFSLQIYLELLFV